MWIICDSILSNCQYDFLLLTRIAFNNYSLSVGFGGGLSPRVWFHDSFSFFFFSRVNGFLILFNFFAIGLILFLFIFI